MNTNERNMKPDEYIISSVGYQNVCKVEAPITDRGPIVDFIFKGPSFLRHVSMKAIDNCLKLKLSGIGSSTLFRIHLST
jgi:hypothetical protein